MGKRRRHKSLRRWSNALGLLLLLGVLWVAYVQVLLSTAGDAGDEQQADAAVVLGAALWQGRPSPALAERLDRAVRLYNNGQTAHIIVSGGYDYPGAERTEAEGMRVYLLEQGVAEASVVLENEATSTRENIQFSHTIMQQHGWRSAFIVTHTYHSPRALDMARYDGYVQPIAAVAPSKVMNMTYHRARETLAYTKWQMDKIGLALSRLFEN